MTKKKQLPKTVLIVGCIVCIGCTLFCLAAFSPIQIAISNLIWDLREPDEYYMTIRVYDYRGYARASICVQNGITVSAEIAEKEYGLLPVFQPWEHTSVMEALFDRVRDCQGSWSCSSSFAPYYHYPARIEYFNEYHISIVDFAPICPE